MTDTTSSDSVMAVNIDPTGGPEGPIAVPERGEKARSLGQGAMKAGLKAGAVHEAASCEDAAEIALRHLKPNDVILVKGSRGMHLERAVARLTEALGEKA